MIEGFIGMLLVDGFEVLFFVFISDLNVWGIF